MNIEDNIEQIRQEYRRWVIPDTSRSQLLREILEGQLATPGKMLRPQLTLTAYATLHPDTPPSHTILLKAVAVEILHNASLLHDDIIDHSSTRRGQPSVAAHWGSQVAVLVGDHLLAQLMTLLDEIDDRWATRLINRTVQAMVESELLQQEVLNGRALTPELYLNIIEGKTAQLFATACALGNPQAELFGMHFGRLFQLRDDIADGDGAPFAPDLLAEQKNAALNALNLLPDSEYRHRLASLLQ